MDNRVGGVVPVVPLDGLATGGGTDGDGLGGDLDDFPHDGVGDLIKSASPRIYPWGQARW